MEGGGLPFRPPAFRQSERVVSRGSSRRDDERCKRDVYAALGVSEYFLYDPRGEYLTPPLQGWRLRDGEYRELPAVTVLPGRGVAV